MISCQQEASPTCYGPDQIRAAYQIQALLDRGITGKGRTIVIVAAYSPPGIADNLKTYDAAFGLSDPKLTLIAPFGSVWDPTDPTQLGWANEVNADVQLAHVVAPGANIVVVQAKSNLKEDVLAVTDWAVKRSLGDVISMSFISNETCQGSAFLAAQHKVFAMAAAKGITLVAGTGDFGPLQIACDGLSFTRGVGSPAADPLVLAVGGTSLDADAVTGAYRGETVWNEPYGASGGGRSVVFPRPEYQKGRVIGTGRAIPDVAYNAALDGGALVYLGAWGIFYGTSASTPQWAGLVTLAVQKAGHRLGSVNDDIYRAAATAPGYPTSPMFKDVVAGTNTVNVLNPDGTISTVEGYPAIKGWDASTGVGSPVAAKLVPVLAAGN